MTTQENPFDNDSRFVNWQKNQQRGRMIGGLFVIIVAVAFFLRELGVQFPSWLFTWPMLLIIIGLVSAIKHRFNKMGWMVLLLIGGFNLIDHIFPEWSVGRYDIPIILFVIGMVLIFKPKNKRKMCLDYQKKNGWNIGSDNSINASGDDLIFVNNIFGNTKRSIISKDFKGGDIRNTFGGCELNLMQAEITDQAIINITQQLSGTKLLIPAHWVVKSDVACVFGSVEDERVNATVNDIGTNRKTLILRGNVFMGGIEIVSF